MTTEAMIIPVSPEQEEVISLHLMKGIALGMVPDERAYMMHHAQKKFPGCKIIAADLDIHEGDWTLTIETAR